MSKKREPVIIKLARAAGIHVPAFYRLKPHSKETISFICNEMNIVLLEYPESLKNVREQDSYISNLSPRKHPCFFIPAPFRASKCINKETTLGEDVKELCLCLVSKKKLMSRKIIERVFEQRKVIAFGTLENYRIYSLEELKESWRIFEYFVHPDEISNVWSEGQIDDLTELMSNEFHVNQTSSMNERVKWVKQQQIKIETIYKKYIVMLSHFPYDQQCLVKEWLRWLVTAGLTMRGWKGSTDKYPITRGECKISDDDVPDVRITHSIRIGEILYSRMTEEVRDFVISLRLIIAGCTMGVLQKDENKKEIKESKTLEIDTKLEADTWDGTPVPLESVEDDKDHKSIFTVETSKRTIVLTLQSVGMGEECERTLSRYFALSGCVLLELFFKLKVPGCDFYSFERIM